MSASRSGNLLMFLILAVSGLGAASCANGASPPVSCTPPQREYKGSCLDGAVVDFAGCTASHGTDLTTEEKQKFGAAVDLGLKSVGGVVELSKKIVATENSEVAIEIVHGCLDLSKNAANAVDRTKIQQEIDVLQAMLDTFSQGTIALSPSHGPYSQEITVTGTKWPANVELRVSAQSVKVATTTTAEGTFQTSIKLDPKLEGVSPPSIEIRVSPVKASTQLGASALYTIVN